MPFDGLGARIGSNASKCDDKDATAVSVAVELLVVSSNLASKTTVRTIILSSGTIRLPVSAGPVSGAVDRRRTDIKQVNILALYPQDAGRPSLIG